MKPVDKMDRDGNVLAVCSPPPLHRRSTGNGVPLIKKGAINFYMNMPCPLKVACKMAIGEFASLRNISIFLLSKTILLFRLNSRLGSIFCEVSLV
jgi:hypothetical protein